MMTMEKISTFPHLKHETLEVPEIIWPQAGGDPGLTKIKF